jgi:calcium-dependent protein kinase
MTQTFKKFDKNGNGSISKEEMIDGYLEMYGDRMSKNEIFNEVEVLWGKVDLDGNGTVDYTEWGFGISDKLNFMT